MENVEFLLEFSLLTYNLDARKYDFERRFKDFINLIRSNQPDIVLVQEVNRILYERLLREFGNMKYKKVLLEEMRSKDVGEFIFSKFPVVDVEFKRFYRTNQDKGITRAKINIEGKNIEIYTSQLEVGAEFSSIRRTQISSFNTIFNKSSKENKDKSSKKIKDKVLNSIDTGNIIFGGDTRILEYEKDIIQPEGWIDAWYEAGTSSNKFTFDSVRNFSTPTPYKDRPDRIWFKPSTAKDLSIVCIEHKLLGTHLEEEISSHYGVWAKFWFE